MVAVKPSRVPAAKVANRSGGCMRKIGIVGGTFDPVHWGHLLVAECALNQVDLEQVIWVPTPCPHYKQAVKFEHRLEMVQKAIADHPRFAISPIAANHSASSYAIQTLIELRIIYPNTQWYWILGLDAFQTLPQWYRRQELAPECEWLVAPRVVSPALEGYEIAGMIAQSQFICEQVAHRLTVQGMSIRWQLLHMPLVGISSSLIRQYCRERCSIRYLVPEAVRTYIATHNLYSERS